MGRSRRSGPAGADAARAPGDAVDVICCGMYRACSTWQYEVVAHLIEGHRAGRRLGYLTAEEYEDLIGPSADAANGWRAFKSHDADGRFAAALARGGALAVYSYRDVRDVVFSLMHKRRQSFRTLLREGMVHQILANDRFWTRQPNVLIQRYEEILERPAQSVRKLADHLGIELDDDEAARIAEEYSIASNKARAEALRVKLEQAGLDLGSEANALVFDPTTLLHWNHMREGRTGTWAERATPGQRLVLRRLCARWLRARGYPLQPQPDRARPSGADEPLLNARDALRLEADLIVGRSHFLAAAASRRFPRLARLARRVLRRPDPAHAVAARTAGEDR